MLYAIFIWQIIGGSKCSHRWCSLRSLHVFGIFTTVDILKPSKLCGLWTCSAHVKRVVTIESKPIAEHCPVSPVSPVSCIFNKGSVSTNLHSVGAVLTWRNVMTQNLGGHDIHDAFRLLAIHSRTWCSLAKQPTKRPQRENRMRRLIRLRVLQRWNAKEGCTVNCHTKVFRFGLDNQYMYKRTNCECFSKILWIGQFCWLSSFECWVTWHDPCLAWEPADLCTQATTKVPPWMNSNRRAIWSCFRGISQQQKPNSLEMFQRWSQHENRLCSSRRSFFHRRQGGNFMKPCFT